MKYVIIGNAFPIIFHEAIEHAAVAGSNIPATSAGFVDIEQSDGKIFAKCYGESISLELKSDPCDSELIETLLNKRSI